MMSSRLLASSASLVLLLLGSLIASSQAAEPLRLYGINYNNRQGADWDWNKCKNYTQVYNDLAVLSGLTSRIRILSVADCGQGPLVLKAAKALGLQVFMGLWVSDDSTVFDTELASLKSLLSSGAIDADTVLGITVGSEAVYREDVTADTIVGYFETVKQAMADASLSDIPVSICDIDDIYIEFPQLFGGDQVVVNSFPFWESQDIDYAVTYLEGEMDPIFSQANGKAFILGETGWPSNGTSDQTSVPSPANQAQYLQDFYCRMDRQLGWAYYYFTGIDNAWRLAQDDQEDSVEAHFGLLNPDLTLKDYYKDYTFTCPDSDVEYSIQLGSASVPTAPTASAPTASAPTASAPTASAPTVSAPSPTASSPTASSPTKPAPTASAPTPTVRTPTASTGATPTSTSNAQAPTKRPSPPANAVSGITSCSAYTQCFALELQGECCPTNEGVYLGCCDGGIIETSGGDSVPTASAPTASSPTASSPTASAPTASSPTASAPTTAETVPTAATPTVAEPTVSTSGRGDVPTADAATDASDVPSSSPSVTLDSKMPSETVVPTLDWNQNTDTNAISDNSGAWSVSASVLTGLCSMALLVPELF